MDIAGILLDIDRQLFNAINQAGGNFALDASMVAFTVLGMSYILVLAVIPLWLTGRKGSAIDVILLIVVSDLISEILKLSFERPRPEEALTGVRMLDWGAFTSASGFAFPSGHALRAFAVGIYLASVLQRPTLRVGAIGIPALIGISRIYLGLHWPSDVLSGALIGAALAFALLYVLNSHGRYLRERQRFVSWLDTRFRDIRGRGRARLRAHLEKPMQN